MQPEYCVPVTVVRSLQALSARPVYQQIESMSQDSAFVAAEDRQADALKFLPGWKGGIYEAVQSTSSDNISRSKLTDRSAMPMHSWS